MKSNSKLNNFIDIYFKSNRQAEDFADQKKKKPKIYFRCRRSILVKFEFKYFTP